MSVPDAKTLLKMLKAWKESPPMGVNCQAIIKQLGRSVRRLGGGDDGGSNRMSLKLTIPKKASNKKGSQLDDELGSALASFGDFLPSAAADPEDPPALTMDLSGRKRSKRSRPSEGSTPFLMTQVHQDDDYIYPSLELSDDEDFSVPAEKDRAYAPKVKLDPNVERSQRPSRPGARKIEVEKGLEMAARRFKPTAKAKKKRLKRPSPFKDKVVTSPKKQQPVVSAESTKPKSKKGYSTVKQRLGKKLKLKFM